MASKDSVRYFNSQLMGLGDRFRQGAQRDTENKRADAALSLQNRYQGMAERRFSEDMKQSKANAAMFKFNDLANIEAAKILTQKGMTVTEENMRAVMPEAKKRVYRSFPGDTASSLGPEY